LKTWKNVYASDMSYTVVLWATWVHNIGFVLFVLAFVAHLAAIVLKPNRPMLRGILTGAVSLDYAEHRHPLWIAEIEGAEAAKAEPPAPSKEDASGSEDTPAPPAGAAGEMEEMPIKANEVSSAATVETTEQKY
jgi:hypothetical protein